MSLKPNLFIKSIVLLYFLCFSIISYGQQPNDCVNAVTVCGNSSFSLDVSGIGMQELTGSNTCSSQENNSIWLEVTIANSGTLAFTLTPGSTDINEDYDFFFFVLTEGWEIFGKPSVCLPKIPRPATQEKN